MVNAIQESDSARTARLIRKDLDSTSMLPLYYQVAESLITAIKTGELPPGCHLGNELEISERLRISRPTIRRAISLLVDRGLVVRRRGVGSVVMGTSVRRHIALTSLYDDLSAMGRAITTRVIAVEDIPAEQDVREALGLAAGSTVTHLRRLRAVDGTPLCVMENYLPAPSPGINKDALADHSLYRLMEENGLRLAVASQVVSARLATGPEARLLRIRRPCAILLVQRTSFDEGGRAVEFARHAFVASHYSFEMNLVRTA